MLVIFDCDGVLVDSEHLAARVFSAQLQKRDIHFSPKQCFRTFKGHTLAYCLDWIEKTLKSPLNDSFLQELEEATREAFSTELQAMSGVREVLEYLNDQNISYCVASNGGHRKVQSSLVTTGLISYFEGRCFSAEDVDQGKPAPDLFLYAAEVMGVPPRFCKVIEDSFTGLRAASAAGMEVTYFSPESYSEWSTDVQAYSKNHRPFKHIQKMTQLLEVFKQGD